MLSPELLQEVIDKGLDFEVPTVGKYASVWCSEPTYSTAQHECRARAFLRRHGLGQSGLGKTAILHPNY